MHVHPDRALPSLRTDRPMTRASGTFDVTLGPLPFHTTREATLGRMALDKVLHGALEATSHGEMLTATTEVQGSAGYVAIERVTGTLDGRAGAFTWQHLGVMTRGVGEMSITVVPDSGAGELAGIAGRLTIHIVDGKHSYDFDYTARRLTVEFYRVVARGPRSRGAPSAVESGATVMAYPWPWIARPTTSSRASCAT